MSKSSIGSILKYTLSFAIAIFILWYLFKDQDLSGLMEKAKNADKRWILISVLLAMISHWLRAYRWTLFVKPLGYSISTFRAFLAVMIGYVSNLLLPRMGEVIKCGALNKLEDVPVSKSLGTIITERIIDLAFLAILIVASLLLETDRLRAYMIQIFGERFEGLGSSNVLILGGIAFITIGILIAFLIYRNFKKIQRIPYLGKAFKFGRELWEGLTSIRKIKNQFAFWGSSLGIWLLYYIMSYIVVFSIPETSQLDPVAGLTILTMGSIGMAAPVQGGIGTYHFMISSVLLFYGITHETGILFATLLHTGQSIGVITVGVISLFVSAILQRKKKKTNVIPQPGN